MRALHVRGDPCRLVRQVKQFVGYGYSAVAGGRPPDVRPRTAAMLYSPNVPA
jgi:hypothetical protein